MNIDEILCKYLEPTTKPSQAIMISPAATQNIKGPFGKRNRNTYSGFVNLGIENWNTYSLLCLIHPEFDREYV
jgi:hypothetical protein